MEQEARTRFVCSVLDMKMEEQEEEEAEEEEEENRKNKKKKEMYDFSK